MSVGFLIGSDVVYKPSRGTGSVSDPTLGGYLSLTLP